MGFSEQPKQVLASTDTRGSSLRAEQSWSWAQQKSFGEVLPLSCSKVCFQPTGSCVSRPLSAAFPPKSRSRALGSVCSQSPELCQLLSEGAEPSCSSAREASAGQRTAVASGEGGAGSSHEDLGLLRGSSFMFMSTQCPPGLSVGKAGEASPGTAWL